MQSPQFGSVVLIYNISYIFTTFVIITLYLTYYNIRYYIIRFLIVQARAFAATPEAYPAAVAVLDGLREQLAHIVALEKYCGPGGVAAPMPSRWGAGRGAVARSGPGQGAGAAAGRGEPEAPLGEYASRLSGKRRRRKLNADGSLYYPPGHPLATPAALPTAALPEAATAAAGPLNAALPTAPVPAASAPVEPLLPFLDTSMH